jgi:polyribonucleotide nucleotidyltransferase
VYASVLKKRQKKIEMQVGKVYEGKVIRLMDFGALIAILLDKVGLVHISEISDEHVDNVSDRLNIGDAVKVKILSIDNRGRVRLSIKEAEKED